ncbi:MAG TPA: hypothetical protein VEL79_19270 [Vicinamibacterales bacterium]|nr:hypothetical protein [Vicinamibacterales bacterium]
MDKLNVALANLEKARAACLDAALAERAYRTLVLFDPDGPVQRAVNRAKRLIGDAPKTTAKK